MDRKAHLVLLTLIYALLCMVAAPAAAEWKISSYIDKMTDRRDAVAWTPSKQKAFYRGIPMVTAFKISCLRFPSGEVHPTPPHLIFSIVLPTEFYHYKMGLTYRFDDGPVEVRILDILDNGRSIVIGLMADSEMKNLVLRSKRLRVNLNWGGDTDGFFEYDLTGAKEAASKIPCR